MDHLDLQNLTKTVLYDKRTFCVAQAGIIANLYIAGRLQTIAPLIADSIQAFIAIVGQEQLGFYWADNGTMKKLDTKRIERDSQMLRRLPKNTEGFDWLYSDSGDGGASGQAVYVYGRNADEDFPNQLSLVRFEFLPNAMERYGTEALLNFILNEANRLHAQSGNIGWGFKRGIAFESEAVDAINRILARYLGFDPGYIHAAEEMNGHTPWAHWINILNRDLFNQCGGEPTLRREAPSAQLRSLGELFVIQGSRLPPIGDANRGAVDIGELPGVARFLKPTRVDVSGLGDDVFDAAAWSARFDGLKLRPWDNA